ncbi:MAG: type IV secretory system conjugative DNA transfer family protein [Clostridiales bacterium]|nr:type IV secretory system conjugative DNA transfer family protein [Clostridiales bacterium]
MTKERVILGENCIYSMDCVETGLNNNRVGVGGAGSGKTVSLLEPELLEALRGRQTNRIVICTKRRVVKKYMPMFEKAGYHIYDMNFADPESGNCAYDPLDYLKCEEDITELATNIVMANGKKEHTTADPFWDDAAISLLSAEISLTIMTVDDAVFSDVLEMHFAMKISEYESGIKTNIDDMVESIERVRPGCYALNCWRTFKEAAPKTAKSIYVTMNATLNAFTNNIRKVMKLKPSVDFEKMSHEKSILFITTSPVKHSLYRIANMFMAQAISELYEIAENEPDGILPIPTHISFDDFATGAKVQGMPEKISIFREKGISCTLLLQSEAQLEKMYGHWGAVEILDNCDSYVFFGGNNYETARSISLRLNVPLEETLYMPVGQVVVFRRGQLPVVTKRYDVTKDTLYQKITGAYEKKIALRERG